MRAPLRPLAAGLVGLSLLVAGCSATTAGQASVAGSGATVSAASSAATSTDAGSPGTESSSSSSDSTSSESSSTDLPTALPSIPSGLASVSVPGLNGGCLSVATTYASIELSFLGVLTGTGNYDGTQVLGSLQGLGGSVPAELKDAFATLTQAVQQANGKGAADAATILQSASVTKAGDDIKAWLDKNCGG